MNSKLPHERLREWADRAEDGYDCPSTCMTICMLESGEINHGSRFDAEEVAAFRKLADEIERFYIPRPRYEDGEPVLKGCKVEGGIVHTVCVSDTGFELIDFEGNYLEDRPSDERVKRPAPNVLDADGMHIWVGDYVWFKSGECSASLPSALFKKLTVDAVADEWVKVRTESGGVAYPHPKQLTHREPDTFEKAMDRFQSILEDKDGLSYEAEDKLWEVHKRLTALMERGAE